MKKVFTVLMMALLSVPFAACDDDEVAAGGSGGVYVCTGNGATVWHCRRDRGALSNCNGEIIFTSTPGSQYKKACKKCYK